MTVLASWVLATVLAAGSPALERLFTLGSAELRAGKFELALRHLQDVAQRTGDAKLLVRTQLTLAQCYAARRDFTHVEDSFARALVADPEAALDPELADPTLIALLEGVRHRNGGTLVVPKAANATVLVLDGAILPEPRFQGPLAVGRHRLTWRGAGPEKTQDFVLHVHESLTLEPLALPAPEPRMDVPVAVAQPPSPRPRAPPAPSSWRLLAEARGLYDVGHGGSAEVGVGAGWRSFFAAWDVTYGGVFGTTLRLGLDARSLLGPFGLEATVDGLAFFPGPALFGGGVTVGVNMTVHPSAELFVEGSGRLFESRAGVESRYLLLGAGVRLHFPVAGRP